MRNVCFVFIGCLFNIKNDPCEFIDLSENEPNLRIQFENKLSSYAELIVPQQKYIDDLDYDPANYDHYWMPWVIFVTTSNHYSVSFQSITKSNVFIIFVGGFLSFFVNYVHFRYK